MSGASCKANGAVYPAASAMMNSVKKPKMEQIQADHELFLQAFESENSLLANLGLFVTTREAFPLFICFNHPPYVSLKFLVSVWFNRDTLSC